MTSFVEAPMRHAVDSYALRSFRYLLRLSFVAFLFAPHITTWAQDDTDVVRVRTDLVTVPVFVTDKQRRRVMNLMASDFEVRDNGQLVKIEYFAAGSERVALIFLLDASGSSLDVVKRQREVALALLSRFGSGSEVAVLRFAEKANVVAPFSIDMSNASRAFGLPALNNHRTAIFDAISSALSVFDERRAGTAERQIIVLISDGLDTASVTRPRDVINAAIDRGVSVYSIQIPLYAPRDGRLKPRSASKGFREIAEKSGGRYFMAGDVNSALSGQSMLDLSPIFKAIEDDLRGQYLVGYYPDTESQDGRFHRIDIELKSREKRELRVRTLHKGYTSRK